MGGKTSMLCDTCKKFRYCESWCEKRGYEPSVWKVLKMKVKYEIIRKLMGGYVRERTEEKHDD